MLIVRCPTCGTHVLPTNDGACPSCRQAIDIDTAEPVSSVIMPSKPAPVGRPYRKVILTFIGGLALIVGMCILALAFIQWREEKIGEILIRMLGGR